MNKGIVLLFAILLAILGCFLLLNTNNGKDEKTASKSNNNGSVQEATQDNVQGDADGKEEKFEFTDDEGNNVEIKADKVVTATGFAGASNYQFYLINKDLYFENISVSGSKEKIATGVSDVYLKGENVTAKLDKDGKVLKENNYIMYE